ncbi:uncharacterized protein CANTADRAFT_5699 [Suhomyces tanzawaensis NRRL Y-17324]|uniref:Uncharacterized protein n=1 Tax=Suhomyces tanzawaensis NRRL Y-17324 TaxID=984487 RepID=A0A1E4SKJ2_9ASCO|nr:uncharacterized protein CANTADRAFT_5699 [Suhomyces tanzawaensis NRRL Y-17324]ODV80024.1 hypothetical protein CANTADRAFT_5699 [Suhomyces tanzawaensis NRRL Y-17324]
MLVASLDKENVVPTTPSPTKVPSTRPVSSASPLRPLRNDSMNGAPWSVKARTDEYLRKAQMSRHESKVHDSGVRGVRAADKGVSSRTSQESRTVGKETNRVVEMAKPARTAEIPFRTVEKSISGAKTALSDPFTVSTPPVTPHQLLDQYTRKQNQIKEHENHIQRLRFELDEIAAQLESAKRDEKFRALEVSNRLDIYKQAHLETTSQLQGLSGEGRESRAGAELFNTIKNRASSMFEPVQNEDFLIKNITKKASSIFTIHNDDFTNIKKKASTMFLTSKRDSHPFLVQNDRFDELTHKTSRFFSDVITTLSPKKTDSSKMPAIDTSFNIDNLSLDDELHELVYDEDEENYDEDDENYLDIDDYESDGEVLASLSDLLSTN